MFSIKDLPLCTHRMAFRLCGVFSSDIYVSSSWKRPRYVLLSLFAGGVEENTHHYQSDFDYDEKRLQAAMLEIKQKNRTFLWMGRFCETWCFLERDTFLRDTQPILSGQMRTT